MSAEPTRAELEEVKRHRAKVREHNERMMDEAGVPRGGHSPRRGFNEASHYGMDFIREIVRHEYTDTDGAHGHRGNDRYFWQVTTCFDLDPMDALFHRGHHFIVGPRGRCHQVY